MNGTLTIDKNGNERWLLNGKLHRTDGPAHIELGVTHWYQHGKHHREDGPAIIFDNNTQYWFINDELHREDGPAIIDPNGSEYWYIHGLRVYTWSHYQKLTGASNEHITCLILKYGTINAK